MEKKKYNLKDETKEELRDFLPNNIKPEDLEIDENVDDKYTSTIFERYKKGEQKNNWLLWSGYLSIAFGVICVISMAILGIIFASMSESLKQEQINGTYDYDGTRLKVIICCIVFSIVGICSFLIGLKIKHYSHLSQEEMIDKVWEIIWISILQFFLGGVFTVILTLVGYFVGIGSDYGAIYYNRIDNKSKCYKKLQDAKNLLNNGIISYEEYQSIRQEILNNFNLD